MHDDVQLSDAKESFYVNTTCNTYYANIRKKASGQYQ